MKPIKLGKQTVSRNGPALVVRLPEKWLVTNGLELGQPLYSVLTIDNVLRVHLEHREWSKKAKIRRVSARGAAYLNINTEHARELGITDGSVVEMSADPEHGVLMISKG
jgi:riboflavin biosynthesis pyrimidine reductase